MHIDDVYYELVMFVMKIKLVPIAVTKSIINEENNVKMITKPEKHSTTQAGGINNE